MSKFTIQSNAKEMSENLFALNLYDRHGQRKNKDMPVGQLVHSV